MVHNGSSNLSGVNTMHSIQHLKKWSYIFHETRSRILLVVLITIVGFIVFFFIKGKWWGTIEPIITILTLGVALFVWYQQITEEWQKDYLPKRFTGHFFFEGKEVMRFENALLTNEGDLRALGQQIGSQMVSSKKSNLYLLKFVAPKVEVKGPNLNKKERFIHYTISFILTELPDEIVDKTKVLIWKTPFIDGNGNPTFKTIEEVKTKG